MGGKSKSESASGSAQAWARPIATNAANQATDVYNQAQPGLNQITGQVQGMLGGLGGQYGRTSNSALGLSNAFQGLLPGLANAAGGTYGQAQGLSGQVGNFASNAIGGLGSGNAVSGLLPYLGGQIGNTGMGRISGGLNSMFGNLSRQAQGTGNFYNGVSGLFASQIPGALNRNNNNAALTAAQGYNTDVLGGKYLGANPALQSVIDATNRGVTDNVNSQFSLAGRYGSGAHEGTLGRALAENEGNLRYSDYNNRLGQMDQAAALSPSLAGAQTTLNNNGINQALGIASILPSMTGAGYSGYNTALGAAGQATGAAQAQSGINAQNVNNYLNAANAESGIGNTQYQQAMNAAQLAPQLNQASYAGLTPFAQIAGMVPQFNSASYAGLPEFLNTATAGAQLPYTGMQAYGNTLGTLFNGGTQTQTQSPGIGGLLSGLGGLASGFGSMGSAGLFGRTVGA